MKSPIFREPRGIYIVDDDKNFAEGFQEYLKNYYSDIFFFRDTQELATAMNNHHPRLIVIDQFLNQIDVLPNILSIRMTYQGGLVVLSGNTNQSDRVVALELGVDDYIVKTIEPREIVARMRAVERRSNATALIVPDTAQSREGRAIEEPLQNKRPSIMIVNGWEINALGRYVINNLGESIQFTSMELILLMKLVSQDELVVGRDCLTMAVFGRQYKSGDRALDNLVCRIRGKLTRIGAGASLKCVRNDGYQCFNFPHLKYPTLEQARTNRKEGR